MPICALSRLLIELEDRLRYSGCVRRCVARLYHGFDRFKSASGDPTSTLASIDRLCRVARLAASVDFGIRAEQSINAQLARLQKAQILWAALEPYHHRPHIEHGIVLKPWVSPREKGAVLLSFEYQITRLLRFADLPRFAERYSLIIAPTWSPPHSPALYLLRQFYPGDVFTLISHEQDYDLLPRVLPGAQVVPLLASNWVNPDVYKPVAPEAKDIDLLMVANFGKYKRHFALFKALRELPPSIKVMLIGRNDAQNSLKRVLTEAQLYGVRDRLTVVNDAPRDVVDQAFARARVSLVMSLHEGSSMVVVESLFADTPVGIFEDAVIGSKMFINASTGRLLKQDRLAEQLQQFLNDSHQFRPRQWAMGNGISCLDSTRTLNDCLKSQALLQNREWTRDLAPHYWCPHPALYQESDLGWQRAECDDLEKRFGIRIGPQPVTS